MAGIVAIILLIILPSSYRSERNEKSENSLLQTTISEFLERTKILKKIEGKEYDRLLSILSEYGGGYDIELIIGNGIYTEENKKAFEFIYKNEILKRIDSADLSLEQNSLVWLEIRQKNNLIWNINDFLRVNDSKNKRVGDGFYME